MKGGGSQRVAGGLGCGAGRKLAAPGRRTINTKKAERAGQGWHPGPPEVILNNGVGSNNKKAWLRPERPNHPSQ